jgi:DNA-binding CsgD family transcriptional regulator
MTVREERFPVLPTSEPGAFCSERDLSRKIARERRKVEEGRGLPPAEGFRPGMYLLRREVRELARLAGLTELENVTLERLLAGEPPHRIARDRGCSREGVRRLIQRLRRKLQRASRCYPWSGLWEVYLDEIRRG